MRDDHVADIQAAGAQRGTIQRPLRLLQLGAPLVATLSGILHAYGMALRKRHGKEGKYWTQPGWWLGLLMDLLGGLCFTLAAPWMAVELLVPLTAVAQLSTAFVCGCCVFQERSTQMQQMGFVLSVTAVVLLGNATMESQGVAMGPHSSLRFWKMWWKPHVLAVHGFWLSSTVGAFLTISRATGFAVLSAYFDGMQFLFTRTFAMILEAAHSHKLNTALLVQLCLGKALCALLAIHWQQQALGEDLTTIGSVLPLLQNLTQASLGATFFGDQLQWSPSVVAAALLAPLGVWLLAQTPEARELRRRSRASSLASLPGARSESCQG